MKFLLIVLGLFWLSVVKVQAVYDPLSVENNRYGIHILDPDEIQKAVTLVNSNGGAWGYVTVPIRADDRDREKWTEFFVKAKELQVIPMLRLATFGRGDTWVLPSESEMLDFANFLQQFEWPIKNRYLIIFNEINHSLEWGGFVDPEEYARLLDFSIDLFKQKNKDYFILPAAMDMAAPGNHTSIDGLSYWKRVFAEKPDLIQKIDGWNSHAYPNPGFRGKPIENHVKSLISYRYELELLSSLGRNRIPIFITETGWDKSQISEEGLKSYWQSAWSQVWNDDYIVAITPFLLQAHDGPFEKFSFLNSGGSPTVPYQVMFDLPKKGGQPNLAYSAKLNLLDGAKVMPIMEKSRQFLPLLNFDLSGLIKQLEDFITGLFKLGEGPYLTINQTRVLIEIADSPGEISLGLGHRLSMADDHGMLFVFDPPTAGFRPSFWMKNTLFPLDIIWIKDNKVVDMTENIPVELDPDNPQNHYQPKVDVDSVLEVNAGFVAENAIKLGDKVELSKN